MKLRLNELRETAFSFLGEFLGMPQLRDDIG